MNDELSYSQLVEAAMQIILNAGDARLKIKEAMKQAKSFCFAAAKEELAAAQEYILLAHQSQTEVIQNEARGHSYEYSLLFTHAQDTLMTIMSELNMAREMIEFFEIMYQKCGNDKGAE